MDKIRTIPESDLIIINWDLLLDKEYRDGVFCDCGFCIKFKNKKPYETVIIKCPICEKEIIYG